MASIVVHGGAGEFRPEAQPRAREGCQQVVDALREALLGGTAALDLAERAVRMLEDDPSFNAGTGSVPNAEDDIEMDAILVCGSSLRFGAVTVIQNVRNPVSVARRLLDAGDPCMLAGAGATAFAREHGFPYVSSDELRGNPIEAVAHGTVGAVVIDRQGNLAAATSTGGIRNKRSGRVGDSPLIGCGALAENELGGVSATGHGESLMRIQIARTVLEYMRGGAPASAAARSAVRDLETRVQGRGGVICIDRQGRLGFAHNTVHMAVCGIDGSGAPLRHL